MGKLRDQLDKFTAEDLPEGAFALDTEDLFDYLRGWIYSASFIGFAEFWASPSGWRWHTLGRNREIVGSGEGYANKGDCLRAVIAHIPPWVIATEAIADQVQMPEVNLLDDAAKGRIHDAVTSEEEGTQQ